jgi:hypothetical protein
VLGYGGQPEADLDQQPADALSGLGSGPVSDQVLAGVDGRHPAQVGFAFADNGSGEGWIHHHGMQTTACKPDFASLYLHT